MSVDQSWGVRPWPTMDPSKPSNVPGGVLAELGQPWSPRGHERCPWVHGRSTRRDGDTHSSCLLGLLSYAPESEPCGPVTIASALHDLPEGRHVITPAVSRLRWSH